MSLFVKRNVVDNVLQDTVDEEAETYARQNPVTDETLETWQKGINSIFGFYILRYNKP